MKITAIESYVLTIPTPQPMARNYAHQKLVVAEPTSRITESDGCWPLINRAFVSRLRVKGAGGNIRFWNS